MMDTYRFPKWLWAEHFLLRYDPRTKEFIVELTNGCGSGPTIALAAKEARLERSLRAAKDSGTPAS